MLTIVPLKVLVRLLVVLPKLAHYVLTDITVALLDLACNLQLILRRHVRHLPSLSHQVEHELRDITTSNRDMLDSAPDDISFGTGNNVGNTIARVDNSSSESTVGDAVG